MEDLKTNKPDESKVALSNKVDSFRQEENNILSENNKNFTLPVKYWIPTLISVISGTAVLIWFVYSLINPLENDILELKTKGTTYNSNTPIVLNTVFLESTTGETISNNQTLGIKNIVYKLKQRSDLVLV